MKRRFLSVLLSCALLLSLGTVSVSADTAGLENFRKVQTYTVGQYPDVPAGNTFAENVKVAYEYNIMQGYGSSFGVKNNITRLASIIIACRLHSIYHTGVNDIEERYSGTAQEIYMQYAAENGIYCAFDANAVKNNATRAEFAAILSSALPDQALPEVNHVEDNAIPDVDIGTAYAAEIYRLYRAGIVTGSDSAGTFYPTANITRGAACAIATRMCSESLRKSISLYREKEEQKPFTTEHAAGSGSYLKEIVAPSAVGGKSIAEFGGAQYSVEEIRAMKNYTVDELRASISTIADMFQYIVENEYGVEPLFEGDILFEYKGLRWSVNKSPEGALLSQSNSCGSITNLARYVLEDDYDEEGYVGWMDIFTDNGGGGGHVFNYFKLGDMIAVVDFSTMIDTRIPGSRTLWVVNRFDELTPMVLDLTKKQPTRVFFSVFIERDVHRDHAPRAALNAKTGKLTAFLDSSYRDEIEVLYFDEEWLKGEGAKWYEYHEFFEDYGVTEEMIPQKLVDSADVTYIRVN